MQSSSVSTQNLAVRPKGTSPRGAKSPQPPDSARRVGFAQPISSFQQPPAFTISLQDLQDPTEALQQSKLNRLQDDSSTLSSLISSVLGAKTSSSSPPAVSSNFKPNLAHNPTQMPHAQPSHPQSSSHSAPSKSHATSNTMPIFPRQFSAPSTLQAVHQTPLSPGLKSFP